MGKKLEESNVDYHRSTTSEIFEEWFRETLLPKLKNNSVIVLDNAPYHSRQLEKIPNKSWRKKDIQEFLKTHNVEYNETYKVSQLLEIVRKSNFKKKYVIDEIAKENGHTVLRLPPYFCIFNPIELIWGLLKRAIRRNNVFPKFDSKVIDLIRLQVDKITTENWKNCIEKVIRTENEYTLLGQFLNENGQRFIINVGSEDSDSEGDSERDSESDNESENSDCEFAS